MDSGAGDRRHSPVGARSTMYLAGSTRPMAGSVRSASAGRDSGVPAGHASAVVAAVRC